MEKILNGLTSDGDGKTVIRIRQAAYKNLAFNNLSGAAINVGDLISGLSRQKDYQTIAEYLYITF